MIDLCVDARMLSMGGIGTVLKHLIPPLSTPPFCTKLITDPVPIYSIQEQWKLPKSIPKCTLFWSPHYNIPLFPIRAKKRIVTIHDVCHLALGSMLSWKGRCYARFMLRQAFQRSDLVLTDSQFSQKELCYYLDVAAEQIQVIYPGVDLERFAKPQPVEQIRKKYGLPSTFFLFVGNVKPHKNLRLVFEAYKHFAIDHPFVIVGKVKGLINPDLGVLNRQALMFEEISDEELPAFYQMATALVFPSLYEGFGLPPLEAMAAGCPVIASNRASIPEICGDGAYYIDPTNVEELATAMLRIDSLRNMLVAKGKLQARKFSWERTTKEYIAAFQKQL